jgi:hypothetical protein
MKANTSPFPEEKPASQQMDAIIEKTTGWRGKRLSQLRALILKADLAAIEEVKWKKPSRPEGVPIWSHDGIICVIAKRFAPSISTKAILWMRQR